LTTSNRTSWVLPIIVIAQFACTSLWFAGNAVLFDIVGETTSASSALGNITSAVQFGFITGTFLFAVFTISDRFSPSKVFFICAIAGAISNLVLFVADGIFIIGFSRFVTGFFLAGIYPVGMKIASDYHKQGLGKALGYLVGALVLGTAFPHLLKSITQTLSWKYVIAATSVLSLVGGLLIFVFVPDGPHRTKSTMLNLGAFYSNFKNKNFRAAAFGYFGHMWELYTFWAFVPIILLEFSRQNQGVDVNISTTAFVIIAVGFLSCIAGGYISQRYGSAKTASGALLLSLMCCILSPFLFQMPFVLFIGMMVVWGMAVVADSPQFSTLVAQSALSESKGTALTIVNCIGFSITIVSLQVVGLLSKYIQPNYLYITLSIGPLLGLIAMLRFFLTEKPVAEVRNCN
jgi:predicted MFS family arabinose efflux permease